MLKWSGFWLNSLVTAPLSCQDPGIYIPNCEATGCWHLWFTGDEQRHRGCWDLAKVSQVVCGGYSVVFSVCGWDHREGRMMHCWGQGGHKQPLEKPWRRSRSPEWCGWGERWGQRKINRCKAAPRRKAQTGRADTAGAVFLPPNSLSGSIIFYLLWVSPCAIESTSWNKAKAEAS